MKRIISILLLSLIISSCGPSEEQIRKAIEQTQVASADVIAKAATSLLRVAPLYY